MVSKRVWKVVKVETEKIRMVKRKRKRRREVRRE